MKIAFFETKKSEQEYIKSKIKGHKLFFFEDELSEKIIESIKDVDIISIFIYSKINKQILNKLKNLRAIATMSTGFEHINLKECKKRKIKVLNVPYYGENTVAEHTFALILALSRKIHTSYEKTTRGNFSLDGLMGFDLKNKTIGIIGLGHIGEHVARISKGFEMKILVSTPKKNKKLEKKYGLKFTNLTQLLKNSDIITLHCPLNKKTEYMINKKNISLIKDTAILINTARGGLIDTNALVKALAKDKLGGAALDVLEEESLIKEEKQLLSEKFPKENLQNLLENHLLLTFKNVIITPHNAFNSKEALLRIADTTISNINCITTNRKCKNLIK